MSYFPTSGDLSGGYPDPEVAKLRGVALSQTAPADGQALVYSSGAAEWTPTTIATGATPVLDTEAAGNQYPDGVDSKGVWYGANTKTNAFDSTTITIGANAETSDTNANAIGGSSSVFNFNTGTVAASGDGMYWVEDLGLFFAGSHDQFAGLPNAIQTSPDGINWTVQTTPNFTVAKFAYSSSLGLVVAAGQNATVGLYLTSPDGITWTLQSNPASLTSAGGIAWSPTLNIFSSLIGTTTGGTWQVVSSPDGITWTAGPTYNLGVNGAVRDMIWDGTNFVATADINNSANTAAYVSVDGINYTQNIIAPLSAVSIAYSPDALNGGPVYTAIGTGGSRYSTDLVTWLPGDLGAQAQYTWFYSEYIAEIGLFVYMGPQIGGGTDLFGIATSYNGVNWNQRAVTNAAFRFSTIAWSPSLRRFASMQATSSTLVLYADVPATVAASKHSTAIGGATANGVDSLAVGNGATASTGNTALGYSAKAAGGQGNISIGYIVNSNTTNAASANNIIFGRNTFISNDSADSNIIIGTNAANALIAGSGNIALGVNTLTASVNKSGQVAIGKETLRDCTGVNNTAVGFQSQQAMIATDNNTSLGYNTLSVGTAGSNNTAVGSGALVNAGANDNTGIGYNVLTALTTGGSNTGIGTQALSTVTIGSFNTALGAESLLANTLDNQTAVGYRALRNCSTGATNTAIGTDSMRLLTSGSLNTAVGFRVLEINNSNNNTGVGYNALALSTGSNNTAFGAQAGVTLTTGSDNTLIGRNIIGITSEIRCTCVGFDLSAAGSSATVVGNLCAVGAGTNCTVIGTGSGSINVNGTSNVGIGQGTLQAAPGSTGEYNVAIGYLGLSQYTSGNSNVAIGEQALELATTANNNVCIGRLAGNSITGGSNNTLVGNVTTAGASINNSTVVGSNATVSADNAVAVGVSATADTDSSVSIGNAGSTGGIANSIVVNASGAAQTPNDTAHALALGVNAASVTSEGLGCTINGSSHVLAFTAPDVYQIVPDYINTTSDVASQPYDNVTPSTLTTLANVSSWPASGQFAIQDNLGALKAVLTYTGRTANSFTGCLSFYGPTLAGNFTNTDNLTTVKILTADDRRILYYNIAGEDLSLILPDVTTIPLGWYFDFRPLSAGTTVYTFDNSAATIIGEIRIINRSSVDNSLNGWVI